MSGKCKVENCYPQIRCAEGNSQKKFCDHWEDEEETENSNGLDELREENSYLLSWSGNSMGMDDLHILKERSSPVLLGSIGEANSGKTTFLGLAYLLMSNGTKLNDWRFSNSYTLLGWEFIANYLRYESGDQFKFPPHTSSSAGRDVGILHLGLISNSNLNDFMFTDVPGEWFTNWATDVNDPNAGNAPWIEQNARGFFLFIDCEGLVKEPGKYRSKTRKMISRLLNHLNHKPVAVLWSKADLFDKINPKVQKLISNEINKIPIKKEFMVSIKHGKGSTYHKNILKSINWLLKKTSEVESESSDFQFTSRTSEDFFISYRGEI